MALPSRQPDYVMFAIILAILVIGVIMVFSAGYSKAGPDGDPYHYIRRQVMWAALGLAAMVVLMRVDYHVWRLWAVPGLVISIGLLGLVLLIGEDISGARRWIDLGPVGLQPSELAKVASINFLAAYVTDRRKVIHQFVPGFAVPMVIIVLVFVLILAEPDLGTALALAATSVLMLVAAGLRWGYFFLIAAGGVAGIILLIIKEPYRMRRLAAFLNPWQDPLDTGYNIIQSLLAIGSGGLFGLGLGESRQKFLYLPEHHTDFIFAVLSEELGFLGSATVVLLFLLLAWRGYRTALRAPDLFGTMLAVGLTTMIVLQAVVNMYVVTALLPATGITLPLISYGGSSLSVTLATLGVLLNISSHTRNLKMNQGAGVAS
ncbi:MAG TPA: putative lipid II flippase FtsW [Firmicutes bacterium]|nr:putative lipid II flippase FtsW [Bacillota bacterium]